MIFYKTKPFKEINTNLFPWKMKYKKQIYQMARYLLYWLPNPLPFLDGIKLETYTKWPE